MEPCKMLWADPCCHGNDIWARHRDPVAYRVVVFVGLLVRLLVRKAEGGSAVGVRHCKHLADVAP